MIWKDVEATDIKQIGYDAESETLGVRFKERGKKPGTEYHYDSVPARVHRALIAAQNIDSYFAEAIKKRTDLYPFTKQGEVLPPAPEAKGSALAKLDSLTADFVFVPGNMDSILGDIRREALAMVSGLDISTPKMRQAIKDVKNMVVKSRTYIEKMRISYVSAEKKRLATVDAAGRRIKEIFEGIEEEVARPLNAWEQKDKDRIAKHEQTIGDLQEWGKVPFGIDVQGIQARILIVEAVDSSKAEEFATLTEYNKANALKELNAALKVAIESETQKAENDRLRAEMAEKIVKEREEAAAKAARERAEADALVERQRLEQRAKDAEAREAAEKEASIERERLAVEAEKARVAHEEERMRGAIIAREQNEKHVAEIHSEIRKNLFGFLVERSANEAVDEVINAIAAGKIPHVSISY